MLQNNQIEHNALFLIISMFQPVPKVQVASPLNHPQTLISTATIPHFEISETSP